MPTSARFARSIQRACRPLHEWQAYARAILKGGWFAQHGEDRYLLDRYGSKGLYVDVGANHPFKISNTYRLYREGWRGIVIDPLASLIAKHKSLRPLDIQLHGAVGDEHGGAINVWEFFPSVVSTTDENSASIYEKAGYPLLGAYSVPVYRLDHLLECFFPTQIVDVLSVDVEGHELACLRSLDLERHRPRTIVVEVANAVGKRCDAVYDVLHRHQYTQVALLGCNAFFETSDARP
jgi:FkbM family methyltransferase